jgi:hypothetical protein
VTLPGGEGQRAAGPEGRVGLTVWQVAGEVGVVVDAHPASESPRSSLNAHSRIGSPDTSGGRGRT